MKILDLPYISQWDDEAKKSKNDCGSVSLTMILRSFGEKYSADEIFEMASAGAGYISFQQLMNVCDKLGYESVYKDKQSPDYLKSLINSGLTPIVLVQYGYLKTTQDKNFKGPHLFVVRGYRDDGYFINDPNFWDNFRKDGDNHFYTNSEFETAWSKTTTDGNTPNALLIVYPKNKPQQPQPPSDDQKLANEFKKLQQSPYASGVWYEAQNVLDWINARVLEKQQLEKAVQEKDVTIGNLNNQIGELVKEKNRLAEDLRTCQKENELNKKSSGGLVDLQREHNQLQLDHEKMKGDQQIKEIEYQKQIKYYKTRLEAFKLPIKSLIVDIWQSIVAKVPKPSKDAS